MKKHILVGMGAAVLLFLIYLTIIILAQDLEHALDQTGRLWYWMVALIGGFGIQAGLFSFIRQSIRERRASATGSVAASGALSAGSMAACCAHHLTDVLPFLGLSGMAIFLTDYQIFFIIIGVLSNAVGIAIMLETIQRHGLSQRLARWKWDMRQVRKVTMISGGLILIVTSVLFFLAPRGI